MIQQSTAPACLSPDMNRLTPLLRRGTAASRAQGQPVLVSVVVPYESAPLKRLVDAFDRLETEALFWRAPGGDTAILGAGSAVALSGTGDVRFQAIQSRWEELMRSAIVHEAEAAALDAPAGPVALGGFSFDPLSPKDHVWQRFPDGLMILPQTMVTWTPQGLWLTLNRIVGPGSEAEKEAEALYRAAMRLQAALAAGQDDTGDNRYGREVEEPAGAQAARDIHAAPAQRRVVVDHGDVDGWKRSVRQAASIIRSGRLEKAVLARSVRAPLPRDASPGRVLAALVEAYPECYTFAFRLGERAFVGATPERLIVLRGLEVETMSLAGSTARSLDPDEDVALGQALLSDPKNLWEHRIVVDAIREGLAAYCARLDIADGPRLLKVRNVQHLWTPVSGCLAARRSVLELVARLHPTPAVGGRPTAAALKLIRELEALDRGWYAGPVGWMDRRGDGEFAVALRSALIGDGEAILFAGCGIVGDSDPQAEYDESALKLTAMIQALERSSR